MMNHLKSFMTIKYGALLLLVFQNTFLFVFMGVSRQQKGPKYASTSAVAIMEIVKLFTCLGIIIYQQGGIKGLFKTLNEDIIQQPSELLKLAVPSFLYTIQNNLLYFALSNLDTATFQVGSQLKILTTAVFSVFMLGKTISRLQWISLVILTLGVAISQLSAQQVAKNKSTTSNNADDDIGNPFIGFIAIVFATCISGFAGVYFEKILKNSHQTTLWMRNIQMSVSSVVISFICIRFNTHDYAIVKDHGFFYGYNNIVWLVIFLQAVGGLTVAVVVKYADNILKGFAASMSIITSALLCMVFFNFQPSVAFMTGACLVIYSVYLYSYQPPLSSSSSSSSLLKNACTDDDDSNHQTSSSNNSSNSNTSKASTSNRSSTNNTSQTYSNNNSNHSNHSGSDKYAYQPLNQQNENDDVQYNNSNTNNTSIININNSSNSSRIQQV